MIKLLPDENYNIDILNQNFAELSNRLETIEDWLNQDSGWVVLNGTWGCEYRITHGIVCVRLNSALSSNPSTGRHSIGTIPFSDYGYYSAPFCMTCSAYNSGDMLLSFDRAGHVQYDVRNPTRWNYAVITTILTPLPK